MVGKTNNHKEDIKNDKKTKGTSYISLGFVIGVSLGVALKNIGLGIALGVAIGAAMDASKSNKNSK